jgi:hypothetical protein
VLPIDDGMLSKITSTVPAIRSVSAGVDPQYGTCAILMPVIDMNSSPDMCTEVPVPNEAPAHDRPHAASSCSKSATSRGCVM